MCWLNVHQTPNLCPNESIDLKTPLEQCHVRSSSTTKTASLTRHNKKQRNLIDYVNMLLIIKVRYIFNSKTFALCQSVSSWVQFYSRPWWAGNDGSFSHPLKIKQSDSTGPSHCWGLGLIIDLVMQAGLQAVKSVWVLSPKVRENETSLKIVINPYHSHAFISKLSLKSWQVAEEQYLLAHSFACEHQFFAPELIKNRFDYSDFMDHGKLFVIYFNQDQFQNLSPGTLFVFTRQSPPSPMQRSPMTGNFSGRERGRIGASVPAQMLVWRMVLWYSLPQTLPRKISIPWTHTSTCIWPGQPYRAEEMVQI